MGKQLASQQWKLKQIQATQRSSADCSDKGPIIPLGGLPASLFFHMCLFNCRAQRIHEEWTRNPKNCPSAPCTISKPPKWPSTSKCTYSWRGNNLVRKRDLFPHFWGEILEVNDTTAEEMLSKKFKVFPPTSPKIETSPALQQPAEAGWPDFLPACREPRLSTQRLGSSDLYSQSLKHNLFWTRFPH